MNCSASAMLSMKSCWRMAVMGVLRASGPAGAGGSAAIGGPRGLRRWRSRASLASADAAAVRRPRCTCSGQLVRLRSIPSGCPPRRSPGGARDMSTIESVSTEHRVFDPPADFVAQANVNKADFDALNASAGQDFAGFWAKLARDEVLWKKPFTRTLDESNAPFYKWFDEGLVKVSSNCIDRT